MILEKIKKYYWIIGVISFTLIFFIAFLFYILLPKLGDIKENNGTLEVKRQDLQTLETKLEKLEDLKKKEKDLKDQEDWVVRAIPTKKEIARLFLQLDGLINSNGGVVKSVSESSSALNEFNIEGVTPVTYSVSAEFRSYQGFKDLLEKSEKSLRYLSLRGFNIKHQGEESNFSVSLNYVTYYRDEQ